MQSPFPPPPSPDAPPRVARPRPRTPVTFGIVAVNVAVFVAQMLVPGRRGVDGVAERFALWAPEVWDGEVWRLFEDTPELVSLCAELLADAKGG